jgi:hypothetical protein
MDSACGWSFGSNARDNHPAAATRLPAIMYERRDRPHRRCESAMRPYNGFRHQGTAMVAFNAVILATSTPTRIIHSDTLRSGNVNWTPSKK